MVSSDEISRRLKEKKKESKSGTINRRNITQNKKQTNKPSSPGPRKDSFWSNLEPKYRLLLVMGIIVLIPVAYSIFSNMEPALADIDITSVNPSKAMENPEAGKIIARVDNNTKSVVISGTIEAGSNVTSYLISDSSDPGFDADSSMATKKLSIKPSSNGYFTQKVDLDEFNDTYVYIEVHHEGKEDSKCQIRITSSDDTVDTTTDTSTVDTTVGGQEDEAISTVKSYGTQYKAGWSIQDAIDSSLNLAETTGTLEVGGDWTATAIDSDNYYVTYTYEEATSGDYSDLVSKTIEFKVNINTGKVTAENYMAETVIGIVKGE